MRDEVVKGKRENDSSRKHDLTIQEVKSYKAFEQFSDEDAVQIIDAIKRFTEIIFRKYKLLLKRRSSGE